MLKTRRRLGLERLESRDTPAVLVEIPDTLTGPPGGEIVAPVNVDNASGIRGAEIRLRYNTALLDATNAGVTAGSAWPAANTEVVANVDDAAGTIAVFVFTAEPLSLGAGSLLDVRFAISATATSGSTTPLDLEQVRLNEGDIQPAPEPILGNDPTDGLITFVTPGSTGRISGAVFADTNRNNQPDANEGVPAVTITLVHRATGATRQTSTDDDGRYEFTDLAAGDYDVIEQQPAALIDGGTNQLRVTLSAGQIQANQDFRELGLKAAFIHNRLVTTPILPVGSTPWRTAIREIVVAAEQPTSVANSLPITAAALSPAPVRAVASAAAGEPDDLVIHAPSVGHVSNVPVVAGRERASQAENAAPEPVLLSASTPVEFAMPAPFDATPTRTDPLFVPDVGLPMGSAAAAVLPHETFSGDLPTTTLETPPHKDVDLLLADLESWLSPDVV